MLPAIPAYSEAIPAQDCLINPFQTVELASPVPGVLAKVVAEESDFIERGQVAAQMESSIEQASVRLAKARAEVSSEVEVNSVNYDFDQRRKARIDTLYAKQGVSFDAKDQADRDFALSKGRLQQAEDLQQIRTLELARAEAQRAQKTIRSPIDGFVVKRYKEAGEYVEDQPIVRIVQLDPLRVQTVVPVEHYRQLQLDMTAEVYPETSPTSAVTAVVSKIDRVADAASGTIGVELTLANPDYAILAGVKCTLQFEPPPSAHLTQNLP